MFLRGNWIIELKLRRKQNDLINFGSKHHQSMTLVWITAITTWTKVYLGIFKGPGETFNLIHRESNQSHEQFQVLQ